jgi:Multimeric flavodoxin WrbA
MKIIGFVASPRKTGNTAWVVNQILESAKEHGAETQSWYCSDLDKPCRSCYACRQGDLHGQSSKRCLINDNIQKLYDELERADALILGSPIYMGQMSAQAKIFNDRLFGSQLYQPRFHPHFKEENLAKKKLILVFTQGNPNAEMFRGYFDYTKQMFQLLGFEVKEVVVVAGMRNELAHERKELHSLTEKIGLSLVSELP